jgi:meso-butanediol dehydrogenase/(S,S)-butanediol dehydrogenase/diacetyl reductase
MSVKNKVIVVAGATGGLGRVVTEKFSRAGAQLVLLGRTVDKLQLLADELKLPEETLLHAVDVSDPDSASAAAEAVTDKYGAADAYLHLVGGWLGGKPLVEVSAQDMENMLQQHLWSTFHMTKAFVSGMLAQSWGRVVVISSPNAHHPKGNSSAYTVGKAAEEALILSLSEEVKNTGVTANIVVVNAIDTKHERDNAPSKKNAYWTTPEEIGATLLHLCSEEAKMINGARIPHYGRSL